ncbi:hypothetical protein [Azospirillum sp. SYSU D00513]|uniref:hypothetical protein n=1 Tax=Azospirillum sp. SYSU D00513 TaxID=2812561 RepID=UPI001A95EB91|nr:hypothetical protein [Azospirillum sp. SYSU D00513]
MTTASFSNDIFISSEVHLNVIDEFVTITQRRLDETSDSYARDSLRDLLNTLEEQRVSYIPFTDPLAAKG